MSGKSNPKGVNNVDFRRKWDKDEFREKAAEREQKVRCAWQQGGPGQCVAWERAVCLGWLLLAIDGAGSSKGNEIVVVEP